jgi:uncharacterized protein involved in outer membrane biogenesis
MEVNPMWKKILLVIIIILAFLLASIFIFRTNIKHYAIQTILKSFPLPNVALANVNFDETTGKLNLEEIKVKNPRGFRNKYIMEADSIDMNISFTTKPNLRLDINEIDITKPVFHVERSRDGKWNFQEYTKRDTAASHKEESGFDFIKEAFAAENEKKSEVIFPRTININNGAVHLLDDLAAIGTNHKVGLFPITGVISLQYVPEDQNYKKISFNGACNIEGNSNRIIKGDIEIYPTRKMPSYMWKFNAYNVPVSAIKPYVDTYSPFIVMQGNFNMASDVKSVDGAVDGNYTMEFSDLVFAINQAKSNIPFLETSVKKLSLYLTNQRGNVVIDFTQKSDAQGNIQWGLGPIAKRAIGMMAIDTVIDIIETIDKGGSGGTSGDIPPEVIEIFKGILR